MNGGTQSNLDEMNWADFVDALVARQFQERFNRGEMRFGAEPSSRRKGSTGPQSAPTSHPQSNTVVSEHA